MGLVLGKGGGTYAAYGGVVDGGGADGGDAGDERRAGVRREVPHIGSGSGELLQGKHRYGAGTVLPGPRPSGVVKAKQRAQSLAHHRAGA